MNPQIYAGLFQRTKTQILIDAGLTKDEYLFADVKKWIVDNYIHLLTKCRKDKLVAERQALMYVLKANRTRFETPSYAMMGMVFGRDHSTFIHSLDAVEHWLKYPVMNADRMGVYEKINNEFYERFP